MKLGVRTFEASDQAAFARLSGDWNPMHMDSDGARRTQMGATVVHGIHGLLWALDSLCQTQPVSIAALKVNFVGPIYVGDTATATITEHTNQRLRLVIQVDGAPATSIVLTLGEPEGAARHLNDATPAPAGWPPLPQALTLTEMATQSGAIRFARDARDADEQFPSLARAISPERVAALLALSRLVGMVCPGLHSIFSGLTVRFVDDPGGDLVRYHCREADPRFQRLEVDVSGGGIEGQYHAFARVPPVEQPSMAMVALRIPSLAFKNATCLVVGGSRGLGEVTAKACAAGGARVILTYATGKSEAERVVAEIQAAGGAAQAIALDVRRDVAAQLAGLHETPSHIYYYATGPIAQRRTRLLSDDVLTDFMRFYATGFLEVCEVLASKMADQSPLQAFYPSSVAIDDTPKGWAEYAMAKAAGEILCREINRHMPAVNVTVVRLPRILTDQTATVQAATAAPVLDVILPIVMQVQAG